MSRPATPAYRPSRMRQMNGLGKTRCSSMLPKQKTREIDILLMKVPHQWGTLLTIAGKEMERITSAKILGVTISNDLTWKQHEGYVHSKANRRLHLLCKLKRVGACRRDLLSFYKRSVRCAMKYACPACIIRSSLPWVHSERRETVCQDHGVRSVCPGIHLKDYIFWSVRCVVFTSNVMS